MINLQGYDINDQIYRSRNSIIFRGIHESECRPVIIKLLDKEYLKQTRSNVLNIREKFSMQNEAPKLYEFFEGTIK